MMAGRLATTTLLGSAWLGCALGLALPGAAQAAQTCGKLAGMRLAPATIGLPTRGAVIDTAQVAPAEADLPATCRIAGRVLGTGAKTPPIRFQVNLPEAWNDKAIQFGGGGFDGTLVDGLHAMPGFAPVSAMPANPLARGFATYGSDAGHQAQGPFDATFGHDPQALENYAGAAVKRVHDTAAAVIRAYYGRAPRRTYFIGGSKGGHEGLVAAQRYGTDYDGVVAYYPAKDSAGLVLAWRRLSDLAYAGKDALTEAQLTALHGAVLHACDELDGVRDGIVANVGACAATISPATFACAPGSAPGDTCLTPGQVGLLTEALRRYAYPWPLANGVTGIGPFPLLSGAPIAPALFADAGREATIYQKFTVGVIGDFWGIAQGTDSHDLAAPANRAVIERYSAATDATSTDLDAFRHHGGRLVIVQGSTDMLVAPQATTDYVLRLAARYGTQGRDLVHYFMQPGYSHGFGDFALNWDSLAYLDTWVETGTAPRDPVATDGNPATRDRTMPLCEYPRFPRYRAGDPRLAASFTCADE
jgi:hypothetical protein